MVIKGRSRGNGAQLAAYLLNRGENDLARVLDIRGTASPDNLKRSLLEMSLSSERTKGHHGLYHAQINPAIGEDALMTPEDWLKAADILERHLGYEGQKRVIVLHEKKGRIHAHVAWERYDHESGTLKRDGKNYKKHDDARAEIEKVFEHQRTRQQPKTKSDYKQELSDLWAKTKDGQSFVQEAEKAGYQIALAEDSRPWRVITPDGQENNLVRLLSSDIKTKHVRERLQPIRSDLKDVAAALESVRKTHERQPQQTAPEPQPEGRDVAASQDLAVSLLNNHKEGRDRQPQEPMPKSKPEGRDVVTSQNLADAMLNHQREKPAQPTTKDALSDSQDIAKSALDKFRRSKDNQAEMVRGLTERLNRLKEQADSMTGQKYYNPITGQEMTAEQWQRMQDFIASRTSKERDQQRGHERERGDDRLER